MLCYEDDANECETKNWLELKIEGKFWGATQSRNTLPKKKYAKEKQNSSLS